MWNSPWFQFRFRCLCDLAARRRRRHVVVVELQPLHLGDGREDAVIGATAEVATIGHVTVVLALGLVKLDAAPHARREVHAAVVPVAAGRGSRV